MMIKTDCRHFPLDRPCALHKQSGRLCAGCSAYEPVKQRGDVRSVLVIKLGARGDVLRTTFLLPGLKEQYPGCRISWLVAAGSEDILRGNPLIETIITAGSDAFAVLARQYYDIVINLDLAPESLAWARLALAREKTGFLLDDAGRITASNAVARRWIGLSANDALKKKNTHTYQYWMARIAGLPRPDYEMYVPLLPAAVRTANAFAARHGLNGKRVIGINPGAGKRWRLKKWTDAGYRSLMKAITAQGYTILLLGGPEEKELLLKYQRMAGTGVVSAGTENSLPEFFALLNLCEMLITGDTLAMHAALGLRKKVVAIFGPTSAAEIELYGRGCKIVTPAACACCYRPSCAVQPDCMRQIPAREVLSAVTRLLGTAPGDCR